MLCFLLASSLLLLGSENLPALPGNPIKAFALDNGLQVVLKEDHSKDLVAACIYVKGGSRTESPDLSGLSHYYEHLIFRGGTERQKELETRKVFQSLGTFFGFTSDDMTAYYIVVPRAHLDEGLWRLADAVMNLKVTGEKIAKERQVVMEEYNMDWDLPGHRVWYALAGEAYRTHPYSRPVIGFKDVILRSDLSKFQTFFQERYVPNQMVLTCVGDFDSDEMSSRIKALWGPYARGRDSFELGLVEPPQREFREVFVNMKTDHSYQVWGFHIPDMGHPDAPKLDVLESILTGGSDSRLFHALKVRNKLVNNIQAGADARKDPGLFVIDLDLPTKNEEKVCTVVFSELLKIAKNGVLEGELGRAKRKVENEYAFRLQSFIAQARHLCNYAANADLLAEAAYLDRIRSVTSSDIRQLVKKYLRPDNCTISTVRPENVAGRSFEKTVSRFQWPQPEEAKGRVRAVRKVLPNGLVLITKQDPSSTTVAMEVFIRGGLLLEARGQNGISNLMMRLLPKGTSRKGAEEIARIIGRMGVRLDTSSSEDYGQLSIMATPSNALRASMLALELLTRPSFPEEEVQKARDDVLAQIRSIEDRSYDLTNKEFMKEIFARSPYRMPILGEKETVSRLSRADLVRFHGKAVVPANLVVAVAGDFTGKDLEALTRTLKSLPRQPAPRLRIVKEPPQDHKKESHIPMEKTQITMNLGRMGVGVKDADYLPLKLAERILSNRLFFKFVYEEGIAYRMWTYMRPRLGSTPFTFEMGVSPRNLDKAKDGLLGEIQRFLSEPVSAEDLEVGKKNLVTQFALSQETDQGQARNMAFYELAGRGYDFPERLDAFLSRITPEEVGEVSRKYLDPNLLTLVVVGE